MNTPTEIANGQPQIADRELLIARERGPHDFGGLRVIVYSGPHYGRMHRVVGYTGSMVEVKHCSGDVLLAPFCDCEVVA